MTTTGTRRRSVDTQPREAVRRITLCGRDLLVGQGVYTPRAETIDLVAWLREHPEAPRWRRAADLCAGAGTIAVLLAHELPDLRIEAVESSPEAFPYLEANIDRFDGRVRPHLEDVRTCLRGTSGLDLVVANPPYIPTHELHHLTESPVGADPVEAVHGGAEGMDGIEMVARAAERLLRPGGVLVIEHSSRQGGAAVDLLRRHGWLGVSDHRDMFGRDRFVTAMVLPRS